MNTHPFFEASLFRINSRIYLQILKQDERIFPLGTFNMRLENANFEFCSNGGVELKEFRIFMRGSGLAIVRAARDSWGIYQRLYGLSHLTFNSPSVAITKLEQYLTAIKELQNYADIRAIELGIVNV